MNAVPEHGEGPYAQTLGRGIEVLELLARGPRTSRAVGEGLGLNRSTAYRLVQTLVAHGLVERDGDGEANYRLTPRLWELGVSAIGPSEIRTAAGREVRELADKYGETVHLAIYHQFEVVYIDKADSWQPIGSYTRLGGRSPAYCVATGKALLAHQTQEEIDRLIEAGLDQATSRTLADPVALKRELQKVREQGYAVNRGEWRSDVSGLAVPLFGAAGEPLAAIGFSGPSARVLDRLEVLCTALTDAAIRIGGLS